MCANHANICQISKAIISVKDCELKRKSRGMGQDPQKDVFLDPSQLLPSQVDDKSDKEEKEKNTS